MACADEPLPAKALYISLAEYSFYVSWSLKGCFLYAAAAVKITVFRMDAARGVYPLSMNKIKVLFICLGNICRSPTAHGVFLKKVEQAGLSECIEVDSAGTAAYHTDKAPDPRAIAAAACRGVDLKPLRARKAIPEDFLEYDYILSMDQRNIADMKRITPAGYLGHFGLFMAFADEPGVEIPDPYYGEDQGFELVLDMVEKASDGLLKDIEARL